MIFKREKTSNYYLHDTAVENVFINEFIPNAPSDFVKVYLFTLMYADICVPISNEEVAKQLSLNVEDILAAWTYWEEKKVIRKQYFSEKDRLNYTVEFVNLKEQIYGVNDKKSKKKDKGFEDLPKDLSDEDIKEMFSRIEQITGRLFQGKEPVTILDWIKDYKISSDFVISAYEYCKKERNNTKVNYVGAVVKEWAGKGLKTPVDIEAHLEENDNRRYLYKRVMKALGFMRNPTEEEKRIMDVWFDDLSMSINTVLEACKKTSGISNPNINYVNAVLTKGTKSRTTSGDSNALENNIAAVLKTYEEEKDANEEAAEKRRSEVFKKIPRIHEIEEEIRDISMKISREMLSQSPAAKRNIESLKSRYEGLSDEKSYLLAENNYQLNYLDVWYNCSKCKDEGILDSGDRCSCFYDKLNKLEKRID